jgi:hypothetical protein
MIKVYLKAAFWMLLGTVAAVVIIHLLYCLGEWLQDNQDKPAKLESKI